MSSRYLDRSGRDYQRDSRDRDPMPSHSRREAGYWISAEGINREVIQTEICFFLGNDAKVKPSLSPDGESGYKITAYRGLTSAMLDDLKRKSAAYGNEVRQKRAKGQTTVRYEQSDTYNSDFNTRERNLHHSQGHSAYTKRGYEEYETEQGKATQYFEPQRHQQVQGYPPNYVLSGHEGFSGQTRREYAQGTSGVQYQPYDSRQEAYQPRTPQSMDEAPQVSRAQVYVPHSSAQYVAPQPSRGHGGRAYIDQSTGQTVYVEAGFDPRYDVDPGRQVTGGRSSERDYRRAR